MVIRPVCIVESNYGLTSDDLAGPEGAAGVWTRDPTVQGGHELARQEVTCVSGAVTSSEMMASSCEVVTSSVEGGATVHHTPVKSRDIGIDMEAIRLSRQDNPYLQVRSRLLGASIAVSTL